MISITYVQKNVVRKVSEIHSIMCDYDCHFPTRQERRLLAI